VPTPHIGQYCGFPVTDVNTRYGYLSSSLLGGTRMKKFLLSTTALLGMTALAAAADLPARTVAPAPVAVAPVFTWSGFYVGGHVGAATNLWNDNSGIDGGVFGGTFARGPIGLSVPTAGGVGGFGAAADINQAAINAVIGAQPRRLILQDGFNARTGFDGDDEDWAFAGGAQVGYNLQFGAFVVGIEADFTWLGDRDRRFNSFNTGSFNFENEFFANGGTLLFRGLVGAPDFVGVAAPGTAGAAPGTNPVGTRYDGNVAFSGGDRSEWLTTVRGRLGFAMDRVLIYGTGGVAFQDTGGTTATTTLSRQDCRAPVRLISDQTLVPGQCVTTQNEYQVRSGRRNDVGWAAGAGFEWAVFGNVSLGFEYLHADFGRYDTAFVDPVLTAANDRRATRVPVDNTTIATLRNPVVRAADAPAVGAPPEGVVRRVRMDDSVDLFKLKLNVRF
jgi:outer membrane immunogenic protein